MDISNDDAVFNRELRKIQQRAKRLILNDYYDHINISDLQYTILKQVTNAKTYKDINFYLWNSGAIEQTLDCIADRIKTARRSS